VRGRVWLAQCTEPRLEERNTILERGSMALNSAIEVYNGKLIRVRNKSISKGMIYEYN
jgi:hypothetical protein